MPKDTKEETGQTKTLTPISATMSQIDLNILIKFINKYDGSREKLNAFLNNCRNAINLASSSQEDILLKYILSQLEGRAESACSIKEFENWEQLENFLKSQYGERKHYAALLSELQDCRQLSNETANQFALRIESCLSKLLTEINISIPTKKKGELAGRVAAMQDLALHTFIIGLNPQLSTVVRCRDPETLNDAINFAVSEEKILLATTRRNANSFQNYARPRPQQNNRPFPRQPNRPSDYQPKPSFGSNPISVCRYCKIPGHNIETCRKREYNNRRFSQFNQPARENPNTSFQGRQPINNINSHDDDGVDETDNNDLN
ncbi:unnamed protein product [Diatraea saccharalis]|uniref:Retrotransposon gag domain-containing protein n=1 Tax=Diatraea saccharalis TaxID=40085 RepID=A0A9N9N2E0_9NEOP|nr:unnamed protein product [Diatraea saccharalis]